MVVRESLPQFRLCFGYGLDSMEAENTCFGTRNGFMAMFPDGEEDEIVWPQGTRFVQCERAPSRHWLLTVKSQ